MLKSLVQHRLDSHDNTYNTYNTCHLVGGADVTASKFWGPTTYDVEGGISVWKEEGQRELSRALRSTRMIH